MAAMERVVSFTHIMRQVRSRPGIEAESISQKVFSLLGAFWSGGFIGLNVTCLMNLVASVVISYKTPLGLIHVWFCYIRHVEVHVYEQEISLEKSCISSSFFNINTDIPISGKEGDP